MLSSSVLLLNHNFVPLTVCSARRAVVMVWTGKAEIIESTGLSVRSVTRRVDIPSIIRLLVFVKVSYQWRIQLSKQNVIKRDHGVCQYCGREDGPMTVDHVVPRALGGRDEWQNLVCACPSCNNRKGSRTPLQAGMQLKRLPKKPNIGTFLVTHKIPLNNAWQPYIKPRQFVVS